MEEVELEICTNIRNGNYFLNLRSVRCVIAGFTLRPLVVAIPVGLWDQKTVVDLLKILYHGGYPLFSELYLVNDGVRTRLEQTASLEDSGVRGALCRQRKYQAIAVFNRLDPVHEFHSGATANPTGLSTIPTLTTTTSASTLSPPNANGARSRSTSRSSPQLGGSDVSPRERERRGDSVVIQCLSCNEKQGLKKFCVGCGKFFGEEVKNLAIAGSSGSQVPSGSGKTSPDKTTGFRVLSTERRLSNARDPNVQQTSPSVLKQARFEQLQLREQPTGRASTARGRLDRGDSNTVNNNANLPSFTVVTPSLSPDKNASLPPSIPTSPLQPASASFAARAMTHCPKCNEPTVPNKRFCINCGTGYNSANNSQSQLPIQKLPPHSVSSPTSSPSQLRECLSCRKPDVTGKRFCIHCGSKFGEVEANGASEREGGKSPQRNPTISIQATGTQATADASAEQELQQAPPKSPRDSSGGKRKSSGANSPQEPSSHEASSPIAVQQPIDNVALSSSGSLPSTATGSFTSASLGKASSLALSMLNEFNSNDDDTSGDDNGLSLLSGKTRSGASDGSSVSDDENDALANFKMPAGSSGLIGDSQSASEDDDYLANYAKSELSSLDLGEGISFLLSDMDEHTVSESENEKSGGGRKPSIKRDEDSEDGEKKSPKSTPNSEPSKYNDLAKFPNRFCYTDINERGLRRGKKTSVDPSGKKGVYQNEDCHFFAHDLPGAKSAQFGECYLFGVFDGHGGRSCSHSLPDIFHTCFLKHWQELLDANGGQPPAHFDALFPIVFREVDEQLSDYQYEGSTGTACLVWKSNGRTYLQVANVGDSTCFYRDQASAKISKLGEDHKLALTTERERILAMGVKISAGATRLIGGISLTRAFGDHCMKTKELPTGLICEPYVSPVVEITGEGNRIVVASDGVWDTMTGDEAFQKIAASPSAEEAAKALVNYAVTSMKCEDNVTAIVVYL